MKYNFPSTDRILGVSAMVISVLTLIIFIYQTNIINEQSKLSVRPRLIFGMIQSTNDSTVIFKQYVQNKGLGPAIINEASITYEEGKFDLDFTKFVYAKLPRLGEYGNLLSTTIVSKDGTLLPNEVITMYEIEIPLSKVEGITKYLNINPDDVKPNWLFELEYTSLYEDETWTINDRENKPIKN